MGKVLVISEINEEKSLSIESYETPTRYERGNNKLEFINELKVRVYREQIGFYNVEMNYYEQNSKCKCEDSTPNTVRISGYYDRIIIENQDDYIKIIPQRQNCLKVFVGNIEMFFKRKYEYQEYNPLNCRTSLSPSDLGNPIRNLKINIGESHGVVYSNLIYSDGITDIETRYEVGTFIRARMELFKIKGRVDQKIPPCKISFAYYPNIIGVKVNNILFYVENDLDFQILKENVDQEIAEFEIWK